MKGVSIHQYDRFIVRKYGNLYLAGRDDWGRLIWKTSPWDAWQCPRTDYAQIIAKKVGGTKCFFNPVIGVVVG